MKSLGPLQNFNKKEYKKNKMEKMAKKCDYCKMSRYLQEECYELIGYLEIKTSKEQRGRKVC